MENSTGELWSNAGYVRPQNIRTKDDVLLSVENVEKTYARILIDGIYGLRVSQSGLDLGGYAILWLPLLISRERKSKDDYHSEERPIDTYICVQDCCAG